MQDTVQIAIVVPCFNEYNRLPQADFKSFLENQPRSLVCFVNDASADDTMDMLQALQKSYPNQIIVLDCKVNGGKAAAVRKGVLHCHKENIAPYIAYLDADLATSLEECRGLLGELNETKKFVFSSRILKIGSIVERKFSRFLFGRIIATLISNILNIKVYDTQCGCKVFNSEMALLLFERPFISKWLFDVELFSRILCHYGEREGLALMNEIPIKRWVDQGESKVKISYFFRLWYDLFAIRKEHRKQMRSRIT